ncbi:MAG: TerC family protein [Elusimicrobia bacterium]|nr:TerC family protein [Elusimicrobiota bacterium]
MPALDPLWIGFALVILGMMAVDLGLFQRRAHVISMREAGLWCLIWAALAGAFAVCVHYRLGHEKALQFVAGYLLEQSLSVDNMFVFVMIFSYFSISPMYQSRILHWGILGAIAMRFFFIFVGVSLIRTFHWMIYVFGILLVFTGLKMAFQAEDQHDPGANPALKALKKFMPLSGEIKDQAFFTRLGGRLHATPLFAALLMVEFSDIIFALDSIPAVIAITPDPFIVYTSNIFAVMGLRAIYFLLAGMVGMFRYLKAGISAILVFVGVKMMLSSVIAISIGFSLAFIAAVLSLCVAASLFLPSK